MCENFNPKLENENLKFDVSQLVVLTLRVVS
jgi:hypothetical protein